MTSLEMWAGNSKRQNYLRNSLGSHRGKNWSYASKQKSHSEKMKIRGYNPQECLLLPVNK